MMSKRFGSTGSTKDRLLVRQLRRLFSYEADEGDDPEKVLNKARDLLGVEAHEGPKALLEKLLSIAEDFDLLIQSLTRQAEEDEDEKDTDEGAKGDRDKGGWETKGPRGSRAERQGR